MPTGYLLVQAFSRPTLGSIVPHESPVADFPLFVSVGGNGLGPAYMGPDHAPFAVENPAAAVQLIAGLRRQRRSMKFLEEFSTMAGIRTRTTSTPSPAFAAKWTLRGVRCWTICSPTDCGTKRSSCGWVNLAALRRSIPTTAAITFPT